MKIILIQDVEFLGQKGEIKEVKEGYFRNYLLPKGLAILATPGAIAKAERLAEEREKETAKKTAELQKIAKKLQGKIFQIKAKVGKDNKLFGSITSAKILDAIKKDTQIQLEKDVLKDFEPIKKAGKHKISLKLGKEIIADIIVEIISTNSKS